MKFIQYSCLLILLTISMLSCEPYQEKGRDLPPLPGEPAFSIEPTADNPNKVIVRSLAEGFFNHVWDLPGGTPAVSSLEVDTVFYQKAGVYNITLHAAKEGGGGTASNTEAITIAEDAVLACDENTSLLTGECTSRCWQLSDEPGSIKVGPVPLSDEFFSSTGLDESQQGDQWCFHFEEGILTYSDNGSTFSACQGYIAVPDYPVPVNMTWSLVPSGTEYSDFKIIIPEDFWMGVEDSGNEYEIVSMTETELVLLTPIKPCDGSASPGWFTLTFVAG